MRRGSSWAWCAALPSAPLFMLAVVVLRLLLPRPLSLARHQGNPGPSYDGTRHNVGFAVLDAVARAADVDMRKLEKSAAVGRGSLEGRQVSCGSAAGGGAAGEGGAPPRCHAVPCATQVILAKPMTFMNNSGEAVQALARFYRVCERGWRHEAGFAGAGSGRRRQWGRGREWHAVSPQAGGRGHDGLATQHTVLRVPLTLHAPPSLLHSITAAQVPSTHILVVADDLDLPLGTVRLRQRGGHGGQVRAPPATRLRAASARVAACMSRPASRPALRAACLEAAGSMLRPPPRTSMREAWERRHLTHRGAASSAVPCPAERAAVHHRAAG